MIEVVNTMSQITESRMPKPRAETRLLSMDPGTDNGKAAHNRVPETQALKQLKARFDGKIQFLGDYKGMHAKGVFKCTECGNECRSNFYEKLKAKIGCRGCATTKTHQWTHAQFVEAFQSSDRATTIKLVGTYKGSQKPLAVECLSCGHNWNTTANRLLYSAAGCPECAKYSTVRYDFQEVKLGKRLVRVQGYEPTALKWLIGKGVKPESIKVFSERQVPEIPYAHRRKKRTYRPDFLVGKRIIEVKSVWTLLDQLEVNKAKALACADAGFEHRMLVVHEGRTVKLPPEWVKKNAAWIEQWCRARLSKPLTILALDPGSSNFGWSVLKAESPTKIRVVATGMIVNRIKELKIAATAQLAPFIEELEQLIEDFNVNAVAIERYMTRGIGGTTIELVNVMIGAVLLKTALGKSSTARMLRRSRRKFLAIPASQWKNELNRNGSLEAFYAMAPTCTPHQMDSIGIGVYAAHHWFGHKPFQDFKKIQKGLAQDATKQNQA